MCVCVCVCVVFLSDLSQFDDELIINNFCNRFISNFGGFSKQILEMLISHLYSFLLACSF